MRGHVLTHLPGTVCTECGAKDYPLNTLFPDVNPLAVGFPDMERYLPLVLALYDVSPMGTCSANYGLDIVESLAESCFMDESCDPTTG